MRAPTVTTTILLAAVAITINSNAGDFAKGNGSAQNPYQIYTASQLDKVRNYSGKTFSLKADINLSGTSFQPIENFTGTFLGNSHAIYNFSVNSSSLYTAFIRNLTGTIINLHLRDVNVVGGDFVGGMVGWAHGGSLIQGCKVTGTISGGTVVGGLVGELQDSIVKQSNSRATVIGTYVVGGLVGDSEWTYGVSRVENSYFIGDLPGNAGYSGGIGGFLDSIRVVNCYSIVTQGDGGLLGGWDGLGYKGNSITNSFYWEGSYGWLGTTKSDTQLKTPSTFTSARWSTSIWKFVNGSYPVFK